MSPETSVDPLNERVKALEQFLLGKLPNGKVRYYKLTYFQGSKQDEKWFPFEGGLRDAILEGMRHCKVMHYRFGAVRPAIVDLKHQERLKQSVEGWSEDTEDPDDTKKRVETLKEKAKQEAEEIDKKLKETK